MPLLLCPPFGCLLFSCGCRSVGNCASPLVNLAGWARTSILLFSLVGSESGLVVVTFVNFDGSGISGISSNGSCLMSH